MLTKGYIMFFKNKAVCFFVAIVSVTVFPLFAQSNPTLPQIDSLWRALYGSPVKQCVVVYNKMAGGVSEDTSQDTLSLMRLTSAGGTATVKSLFPFKQCQGFGLNPGQWGVTSGYAISRDGSRIAAQNCSGVIVCDSSGAHKKVISTTSLGSSDNVALCFDDSTYNGITFHRVVYAAVNWLILRTTITDTNTAIKTDTLWKLSVTDSCYDRLSPSGGYSSVNKAGHYLSFQVSWGVDLPVVVDLISNTYQFPTTCMEDGCAVRLCRDTLGTVSFHQWSHYIPTTLWRWGTPSMQSIGSVPCLIDPVNCSPGQGDPGQGGENWCETNTNYMIQVGDNNLFTSPGCYTKAYIRKGKTTNPPQVLYLGDYFGWPNMWIDTSASTGVVDDRVGFSGLSSKVILKISGNEVSLTGTAGGVLENARLINVKGAIVSRAEKVSSNKRRFAIAQLPMGIYVLSWRESNSAQSRAIAITR